MSDDVWRDGSGRSNSRLRTWKSTELFHKPDETIDKSRLLDIETNSINILSRKRRGDESSWTDALPTYRKLCKRYLSRSRGGYSTWSRSRWPPHARTHVHAALSLRANSTELSCQRSAVRVHWGHAPVPSSPGPTAVIDKRFSVAFSLVASNVEETRINHV